MTQVGGTFWRLGVWLAAFAVWQTAQAAQAQPQVVTRQGRMAGVEREATDGFYGIPYAAPPLGPLRWRSPQPARSWAGVLDATRPKPPCAQPPLPGVKDSVSSDEEDCLYINVTVPKGARDGRLPVMVWLYGGAFTNGSGNDYDGERLAARGHVILVTFNYRLGILGFFGLPGLVGSGDFGLQDEQAALRWVRDNVAAFGGDPHNVTAFGQSAGAMGLCAQLVSPGAAGLFQKAIIQSGSCLQSWPPDMLYPTLGALNEFADVGEIASLGQQIATKMGCSGADAEVLACMRRAPLKDLLAAWPISRPAFHTPTLPLEPSEALRLGKFHRIPIIWGGTHDEERGWAAGFALRQPFDASVLQQTFETAFDGRAGDVAAIYSAKTYGSPALAWAAAATDVAWSCPTLQSVRYAAEHVPVFSYEFDDPNAPNVGFGLPPGFPLGAGHATDLPFLFDLGSHRAALSPSQAALSEAMMQYWTNFAKGGDPNGPGLPKWPTYNGSKQTQSLAPAAIRTFDLSDAHHCELWSTIH